jgi:SAM-dependent methyltransferase
MTTTVHCVLCGPRPHRALRNGAVHQCASCGLGRSSTDPPAPREQHDDTRFDAAQRRYEAARRLRWVRASARPATLLEAGCAGGYFVAAARRAGIDARGVEVSASAVHHAVETLGLPVLRGPFEAMAPSVDPVEAVCAFGVLEHVEHPRTFLSAARAALVPGGRLFLEVPNAASAAAQHPHRDPPARHRWHFTPWSLVELLIDLGFRVETYDTVFSRYYRRPLPRLRRARDLVLADTFAARTTRISHPRLGDLLRLVARRPEDMR